MGLTYDAFDRIIEQDISGVYTQVLYTPIGKIGIVGRSRSVDDLVAVEASKFNREQ